jgi:outer membrane receptor protein involved in Fe transport
MFKVICSLIAGAFLLHAQSSSGTLSGTIFDPANRAVAEAKLIVRQKDTGFTRSSISGAYGGYRFSDLAPGIYDLTAVKSGFHQAIATGVHVEVNHNAILDLHLEIGSERDSISVSSEVSPLQTGDSTASYLLRSSTVEALPLEQRNAIELVTLGPGAIPRQLGGFTHDLNNDLQAGNGAVALNPPINGARSEGNTYVFDGAYNTDRNTFVIAVIPPLESIQEFRIQTSVASASASEAAGGVVELVSKSGTHTFHGDVFEYLRNEVLDAHGLFDDPTLPKPVFRQNQYGGTLGGPIAKRNTYFFASFEGLQNKSASSTRHNVPDMAVRAGDFSGRNPIFDPLELTAAGGRAPFPNGIIPPSRLDPVAQKYLALYEPFPNQPAGASSNYIDATPNTSLTQNGSFRLDHQFTEGSRLFARYTINNATNVIAGSFPELPTDERSTAQQAVIGHTWAARDWVNEARVSYTRFAIFDTPESAYKTDVLSQLGIQGFAGTDPANYGLPYFQVGDFDLITDSPTLPQTQRDNIWDFSDSVSHTRGRHTFRFGFQGTLFQFNYLQSNMVRGQYEYSGQFTNDPNNPSTTGDAFADFLLGYPDRTERTQGSTQAYLRQHIVAAYVADNWRITDRLTLDTGLRYEYDSPYSKQSGDLLNLDYSSLPSAPTLAPVHYATDPHYLNFAPRVGLAYRLPHIIGNRDTVFRAGYGMFFTSEIAIEAYSLIQNQTQSVINESSGLTPQLTTAVGFPQNSTFGFPSYFGVDQKMPTPYVQQWNANIQQDLGHGLALEIAYIGTKGTHLGRFRRFNTPQHVEIGEDLPPRPGDLQSLRTFPQLGPIFQRQDIANSNYNSLQIKVDKRLDSHFSLLASYVWSKSIDDADSVQPGQYDSFGAQDESDLRKERGLSFFNVGRRFSAGFVYNLPVASRFTRGWQLSGIITLQDGTPGNPVYFSEDFANTGTPNRPNVVPGQNVILPVDQRSANHYFNTAAFSDPQPYTFGNAGRDTLPGPGNEVVDLSLHRTFRIREAKYLEFRAESFNVLNHPNIGIPGPYPDFGPIFGQILSSGQPRRFQVALRFGF